MPEGYDGPAISIAVLREDGQPKALSGESITTNPTMTIEVLTKDPHAYSLKSV